MNTVRKLYESDENGTVHLDLKRAELEALAGALADDPIVRPEQPPLDKTLPVE